jgi:hypothetical protein
LLLSSNARLRIVATASLVLAACSGHHDAGDGGPPEELLGDGGAPDFDFLVIQADNTVTPVADGGTVALIKPVQGGRVIFAGVRATNVDGNALQITGALRDLKTQQVRFDSRTIDLIPTGDGWGVSGTLGGSSGISNFSNVAVCPNQWSSTNIFGTTYGLEITILDRRGRQLTKAIQVTPECAEPMNEAECLCMCKGGYVLGEMCADGLPDAEAPETSSGGLAADAGSEP